MHHEFHPADAPDPDDPDVHYSVAPNQITAEVLILCEKFFRHASPVVRTEVDQFLIQRGHHGGFGWLLDAVGFAKSSAAHLAPPSNRPISR